MDFLPPDFFPADFRPDDFLPVDLRPVFFRGTFAPFSRASERPIAIACFLLVTFFPLPLLSVPFLRRRIADPTRLPAAFPYFRPPDFFRAAMTNGLL